MNEKPNRKYTALKIIAVVITLTLITVPTILNFYNPFNITKGDWLDFWGSYIGGIATLTGILLTLWKSERDKKEEKNNLRPIIVPLKKSFTLVNNNNTLEWHKKIEKNDDDGSPVIYTNFKDILDKNKIVTDPKLQIINLGKGYATDITLKFKKSTYLKNWYQKNNIIEENIEIDYPIIGLFTFILPYSDDKNIIKFTIGQSLKHHIETLVKFLMLHSADNSHVSSKNEENILETIGEIFTKKNSFSNVNEYLSDMLLGEILITFLDEENNKKENIYNIYLLLKNFKIKETSIDICDCSINFVRLDN